MLSILAIIFGLVSLVCGIMVLIKLFQEKGVVHLILGIVTCGIYPLIWGWMNVTRLNIKNIMIAWTVSYVLSIILNVMSGSMMAAQ